MIEFCKAYKVGDKTFASLAAAQQYELASLLQPRIEGIKEIQAPDVLAEMLAGALISEADKIIDILSTTATSKPRARRINGGTKKRKAASLPLQTPQRSDD